MKGAYPIVLTKGDKYIVVDIPDFDINTQGESNVDAMEMARDAIGLCGISMEDDHQTIPEPSDLQTILSKYNEPDQIITLVDVDFKEYRRKNDNRTVRRNVSLPSWLDFEAEKAGINVSAVLQGALKEALNIG
ncbi:MAG: type II toxin-antitoxin system HicB family antitoxin [Oscillospiraceae bacterium]|nr:type II toxin-antitoxin system HicB family antitoxin [Oscillospiraceae bacterium]